MQSGRRCIVRQLGVIAALQSKDLPIEQAQAVLEWLEETQRTFEDHYKEVLSDGLLHTGDAAFFPLRGRGLSMTEDAARTRTFIFIAMRQSPISAITATVDPERSR